MADVEKSEKITINIGLVDLGQIDLLVDEGFYANRTDFIRTAIRRQLDSRRDLEELREAGRRIELRVLGLATIVARASSGVTSSAIVASPKTRNSIRRPASRSSSRSRRLRCWVPSVSARRSTVSFTAAARLSS